MRHYPTNSPEAIGRIIAIALMADGAIDSGELAALEKKGVINKIGLNPVSYTHLAPRTIRKSTVISF